MVDSRYQIFHMKAGHLYWATTKEEAFRVAHRITTDMKRGLAVVRVSDLMAHKRKVDQWEVWGTVDSKIAISPLTCKL